MKNWQKNALKITVFISFFFQSHLTIANEFPIDPNIQKRTFENGLTYYIKENSKPENKVELRLMIKAGSMMEEDHQRGLAHLLEHTAFNGSKNFPKNSIDEYFNSIGLNLGSHFNAYTSFGVTVYEIQIPTNVEGALDKGLLFFSDIIKNLDLTDESFEKERKIVEEEVLSALTGGTKYQDIFYEELLKGSKYPERLPQGDLEIIRNFKYQDAVDFYNKWYQPENIGLFIVGDVNKNETSKIVEKYFSKIPNETINNEIDFTIPEYTEDKFLNFQDEKENRIEFTIYKKSNFDKINTKENYRKDILRHLTYDIFQKRLDEISYSNDPDFISSAIRSFNFNDDYLFEYFFVNLTKDNLERGITRLYTEAERVLKYGFNESELKEAKDRYLLSSEENLLNSKTKSSTSYIGELMRNFTKEEMISGIEYELKLDRELIPTLTINEVNEYFSKLFNDGNKFIEIKSPPNIQNLPNLNEIKAIQNNVKKQDIKPYENKQLERIKITDDLKGSKIIKKTKIPSTGIQKIILENGITIFLKPTDFEENIIYFQSRSDGGYSTADNKLLPSAKLTNNILELADIGNLKKVDLRKLYPAKSLNVYPVISRFQEGVDGYSTSQFLEEMFMLIYQNFYHLNFDKKTVENFKAEKIDRYNHLSQDPRFEFDKNFYETMYNNHPRALYSDVEFYKKINFDDVKYFYEDRFKDAKDFIFTFVGDFEIAKIEPYIEKYLGSLKTTSREESFVDHNIRFKKDYQLFLYEEENPLNLNNMRFYNGNFKNTLKERFKFYFIEEILNELLMEEVREKNNLVYSISATSYDLKKFPTESYSFIINYSSSLKNEEEVNQQIDNVINRFIDNDYEDVKFENAKKKLLNDYEENLKKNIYWEGVILQNHTYGEPISRIKFIDTIINSTTRRELSKLAKQVFRKDYLNVVEKLNKK